MIYSHGEPHRVYWRGEACLAGRQAIQHRHCEPSGALAEEGEAILKKGISVGWLRSARHDMSMTGTV